MKSISQEDYIKRIYKMQSGNKSSVASGSLAIELGVSKAAVTDMTRKLAKEGLINYQSYKGSFLTRKGERKALDIIRRHRLWELFLVEALNLNWAEVHDEAENLEHYTSEFLINRIDKYLNFPEFDPHGDPIPDKNGKLPKTRKRIQLSKTKSGKDFVVCRVDDKNAGLVDYLGKVGIGIGVKLKIIERLEFDNSVMLKIKKKEIVLSEKIAEKVFVSELKDE
ncbi:MAG: metal-dependent transcriptional regulator [Chlorobi bacterium]|nr:metal-dependent transcriptional regulator [Chlorobiota bacterium]